MVETGNRWKKVIIIGIVILFALSLLILFIVGVNSLATFFKILIGVLVGLSILFGLAYIFYLVFIKKEFKDIPATYKKKVSSTAKQMKQSMLGDLYLSGDVKHNRIKLGKYYYLRMPMPKQVKVMKVDENNQPVRHQITNEIIYEEHTQSVEVDCFLVDKAGLMSKLFDETTIILCKPEDHDFSAIFNDVTLKGFNLVPLDNQFHTLNTRSLDIDIAKGVTTMYFREVVFEVMRDLDKLVKMSIGLDSRFSKEKSKSNEFEIPKLSNLGGGGG